MNQQKTAAFSYIDGHRDEMISLWQELVTMESGSLHKAGVDAVAKRIGQVLDDVGAKTEFVEFEQAGNLLVSHVDATTEAPSVIFMGHMDTVFKTGTVAQRPFCIKDGKAYGPGVLDMKGGIVAFLYALKALKAAGYDKRPLKVLLAGDEEVGHEHSTAAKRMMAEAKGAAAAFNCETGFIDDGIVVGRKGTARFIVAVKGVAAHAGNDPENGRNAIIELAHKAIAIQALTDWEEGTTVNVGVISGGSVANAVPEHAQIVVDIRYKKPEAIVKMEESIRSVAAKTYIEGTTTTVTRRPGIEAMETTAGVKELFALVAKVYEENGFGKPYEKAVGGGADSAYTVMAGVPTVCAMGVKGERNHSPEEYALVESLFERAKLLAACVLELD
ncbi:MAG: M20 family metallopeptidase [Sporomusaceae bacterium]|nr:M20 family metallopeptidase [Sporomusaceae bacterium]